MCRDGNNISIVCNGESGRNIWGDGHTHGHGHKINLYGIKTVYLNQEHFKNIWKFLTHNSYLSSISF